MIKRCFIFIIILILIIIFIIFYKSQNHKLEDITIFGLWNNEFVIKPKNKEQIQLNVFKTISNGKALHKKIAPGSYGNFTIRLIKLKESNYEIILKELTLKPKNLIFILDGHKYNSIVQMQEKINDKFKTVDIIKIEWRWEYETDLTQDIEDTEDGQNAKNYIFEIKAIIENEEG